MKLLLRPRLASPALATAIAADPGLGKLLGAKPNAAVGFLFTRFADAGQPWLQKVLRLAAAHGESLTFLRDLQCSEKELDAAGFLEVVCRTTIGQSPADADHTRRAYQADSLQVTASRWPVRLPQTLFLGKPVPPATIAHVDQWTGEYVVGPDVAQALEASGLRGWALGPVLLPKSGQPQAGAFHLRSTELLPAALEDATTRETFDDGPRGPAQPRRDGLLSYAAGALDGATDFARTAEPWGEWRTPTWVVRQSVRRWTAGLGLRGWAFRPVLEAGTALHAQHLQLWANVHATLAEHGAELA